MPPTTPAAPGAAARARRGAAARAARGWPLEAVLAGTGSEVRSRASGPAVAARPAPHRRSRAGRPQTTGCVARAQGPALEECRTPAFARYLVPTSTGRRLDLDRYARAYNTARAHPGRGTNGRTPDEVLGKAAMWAR